MNYAALIPARGGSKGLPRKNVIDLAGKPLIAYSIEAALGCAAVGSVYVTTDDTEIASVSVRHGAQHIARPAALATDDAPTFVAVEHAIAVLAERGEMPEHIVLLQPTSPLRDARHLAEAIAAYEAVDVPALISVCEEEHHPYKSFRVDDSGRLEPLFDAPSLSKPRQELPKIYRQNGAIYIIRTETLLRAKSFYVAGCVPYVMSAAASVDVDTIEDLHRCEEMLEASRKATG
ncbi:acylneuraminate cytidylyltransferase family protein [Sinorhizobium sp. RAC02]|uniref:acylneuraminate cytidylyltransferase family protein n=1 Tax=Sinorhizobium sp. RAC02 TaxID=1842534 RepID=UPI00083DB151|nr:acylneuraminate cytidylyltransferase family protein [Sinorhizobium sp. RAC02]AOF90180.1 cytidylyltransferase family protein [Sinorhizobium sp. RAC02]